MPDIGPAPVLALLVGLLYTGVYLLIRGTTGLNLPLVLVAAVLGAYGGQALGSRLGDPLPIGDFGFAWASGISWLGILLIVAASALAPSRDQA